eukprot:scaffold30523_cov37-Cyclotella_meneghiniana.AAC.7
MMGRSEEDVVSSTYLETKHSATILNQNETEFSLQLQELRSGPMEFQAYHYLSESISRSCKLNAQLLYKLIRSAQKEF